MRFRYLFAVLSLLAFVPVMAQMTFDGKRPVYDKLTDTYLLTLPESTFGHPYSAVPVIDDTVSWVNLAGKMVRQTADFPIVKGDTVYQMLYAHNGHLTKTRLRLTYLPILSMEGTFNTEYTVGNVDITMPEDTYTQHYQARIKWAGGTTTYDWIHKHNYHLKFVDENLEKMDVSFFGLRNDNHWRLDAGIVDMLRFRNKAAHALWADFGNKPYYAASEPKARNYARGHHVEVFLNGDYMGFFDLTEFLDRKQMKLKKYDEANGKFRGMMWKAKVGTEQTLFAATTPYDNNSDSWAGFEVMYPDFDEVAPTNYRLLYDAIKFVSRSDSATFASQVGDYFDLPILVDYYVFIHTLYAIDNSCKNIIWGCYDSSVDKKLTLSVWDLEATVGQHWYNGDGYYRAPEIQPENDLDKPHQRFSELWRNKLFMQLKALPDFHNQVLTRYWQLRQNVLRPDSLIQRYADIYAYLEKSGALDRETERWSGDDDISGLPLDFEGEFEYLSDWIRRRIAYLDTVTFAYLHGDVDGNGVVSIMDLSYMLDYLLDGDDGKINILNADMDSNAKVDLKDLALLIDLLLTN